MQIQTNPKVQITIPKEQLPKIKDYANSIGISLSALFRVAVGEYIKNNGGYVSESNQGK